MGVESSNKETIENFAADFDITGVPESKYMVAPIAVIGELYKSDPVDLIRIFNGPVRVSNFSLFVDDSSGTNMLMAEYESPAMEKYFDLLKDTYTEIDHDPDFTIVISYDYEGDFDLDNLSFHFNRYLPMITLTEDISGYYDETETDAILFGYRESPED